MWDRVLVVRLEVVTRLSSNARSSTANLRSCSRVELTGEDLVTSLGTQLVIWN